MLTRFKIKRYLSDVCSKKNIFYRFADDYISKRLKASLRSLGFTRLRYEIEWGAHYKRITVFGKSDDGIFLSLTVDEREAYLMLSFSDDDEAIKLTPPDMPESADYFYNEIAMQIMILGLL